MRIINRQQFLALPAGVIYCKYQPCIFDEIEIKGETTATGNDCWSTELTNICADGINDTGDWTDALDDMQNNKASYPLGDEESRHGCFDADQLFFVYEQADLKTLHDMITKAIASTPADITSKNPMDKSDEQ